MTLTELSKATGVHRSTLHFWLQLGWLQAHKVKAYNREGFAYLTTLEAFEACNRLRQARGIQPRQPGENDSLNSVD